jgi:hypothetical protein
VCCQQCASALIRTLCCSAAMERRAQASCMRLSLRNHHITPCGEIDLNNQCRGSLHGLAGWHCMNSMRASVIAPGPRITA